MNYSFFQRIRDILLLSALFFLVKTAYERTISFINAHKNSIVHELDRTFLDQIYIAQRQLHFLENNYAHDEKIAAAISDIKKQLLTIEEKYKTNSPGIMLLGPIGSASIVAKEEKLQKKLLDIVNDVNKILYATHNKSDEYQTLGTINIALASNKNLIQAITV
jgi:hypothetical protein